MNSKILLFVSVMLFLTVQKTHSCTNILVTKGASVDSATYLVYLNDGEWLYNLNQTPAKNHSKGDSLVYTSMTGIKSRVHQVSHTYAIIGFQMNEH